MAGKADINNNVVINAPLPMPSIGKAEADYKASVHAGGSVNVNVHLTAENNQGGQNMYDQWASQLDAGANQINDAARSLNDAASKISSSADKLSSSTDRMAQNNQNNIGGHGGGNPPGGGGRNNGGGRQGAARITGQRDRTTKRINDWISGLGIDEASLGKIRHLQNLLTGLNSINTNAAGGMDRYNAKMAQVNAEFSLARRYVGAYRSYDKVSHNRTYAKLGHERGIDDTARTVSGNRKAALETAFSAFNTNQSVANLEALEVALDGVKKSIKDFPQIDGLGKIAEDAKAAQQQVELLQARYGNSSKWKPVQQASLEQFNNTYSAYQQQLNANDSVAAAESVKKLQNNVVALNQSFESGSGLVGVYDGKLTKTIATLAGVGTGIAAIRKVMGTFRQMANNVTQIDTAMTELKKVTDETAASYARFQRQSGKTAIQIGSRVTDLINTSVEYGRMGYSLAESQQLGITTTKFANTGNFSGVTDASDALIAIIRGFDELDIGDAEKVSDKLTAVANAYAVTASDIAAGLQRSASALNLGGVNVDQATAMITAISEVTRDSSAAGNAIKTLSMRVRGAKTE